MATAEADFELFAGCQKKNQSTDAYYKVLEYPKNVLALKRLMTDFDPGVATGTKRTQEQV